MKIAIVGLPKTGTTALFESIKKACHPEPTCFFEPKSNAEIDYIQGLDGPVLAKFMMNKLAGMQVDFDLFDKVVVIVRDPRDFVVSSLIYRFDSAELSKNAERFDKARALFVQKEKAPQSISVGRLYDETTASGHYEWSKVEELLSSFVSFVDSIQDPHVLKYEDFVDSNLDQLSAYLGVQVTNEVSLSGWTSKIARKGTYGDWKNWFTGDDRKLSNYFDSFLERFGYEKEFAINKAPEISSEHCSEYIDRLVAHARVDPIRSDIDMNTTYISNLETAVSDGKHVAMTKLALLLLEGEHVDADTKRAEQLFDIAQQMGNVAAMRELGKLRMDADPDGAADLFARAVEQGDRESCFHLGMHRLKQAKHTGDFAPARSTLELGAERGSKSCMKRLIKLYRGQEAFGLDEQQAKKWEALLG